MTLCTALQQTAGRLGHPEGGVAWRGLRPLVMAGRVHPPPAVEAQMAGTRPAMTVRTYGRPVPTYLRFAVAWWPSAIIDRRLPPCPEEGRSGQRNGSSSRTKE